MSKKVVYKLKEPVEFIKGDKKITEVTVKSPKLATLKELDEKKNTTFEDVGVLILGCTDLEDEAVIDELDAEDVLGMMNIIKDFMKPPRKIPQVGRK